MIRYSADLAILETPEEVIVARAYHRATFERDALAHGFEVPAYLLEKWWPVS
jgi:hypothetical protein